MNNKKERTSKIENFIGIYDNYIPEDLCKKAINFFENQSKFDRTVNRIGGEGASVLSKKDQQYFAETNNLEVWGEDLKALIFNFDIVWKNYALNVGAEHAFQVPFHYTCLKIQKTLPTEGYHVWHVEHGKGYDLGARAFVFSIYLNDVEEGGETEFLHFSKRVKPKTGRVVIWPASFPYLHRGNPPLSGEKYILTSWMMLK